MGFITNLTRMYLTRSFKPFLFTNDYDKSLEYGNSKNLGLYVHIPFCRKICDFCPYCKEVYNKEKCEKYIDALIQEIHMVGTRYKEKTTVTSLYFGGGSPALAFERIKEIIDTIKMYFDITEGIGIELHPDDLDDNVLKTLKDAGVTKISIGIQSFQEKYALCLGRETPDITNIKNVLHKNNFQTISIDLIFALPGQCFDDLRLDIDMAFSCGANHVAIYPFIDFSYTKSKVQPMMKKQKRQLLDKITLYCTEKGYIRDSIWTFAKDRDAKYSSMTRDNFLGFGCSATTLLKNQFKINTFSVDEYIKRIKNTSLPTALTCRFTSRQRMIYYLFWTAYSTRLNADDFERFFGTKLKKAYGIELWLAKKMGFIKETENGYEMTLKGAFYYHHYENYYTLSYIDKMWNVMRKTPFPEKLEI